MRFRSTGTATGLSLVLVPFVVACGARSHSDTSDRLAASSSSPTTLSQVVTACGSSLNSYGIGSATVSGGLTQSSGSFTIPAPCRIHLAAGASISLSDVTLSTANLYISDDGAFGASRVSISGSSLSGLGRAGFWVQLNDAKDSFTMTGSQAQYPLLFWVRVHGLAGSDGIGGGKVTVNSSTITSTDPTSSGIQLVASGQGGSASFNGDTFTTNDPTVHPLLLAGKCTAQGINGAPSVPCQVPAAGSEVNPTGTPPPLP